MSGGSTVDQIGYSDRAPAIRVDMPHRLDIIAISGKIGNPPFLACLDTNRRSGWLAATVLILVSRPATVRTCGPIFSRWDYRDARCLPAPLLHGSGRVCDSA